jgi:hypothetical protein
MKRTAIAAAGLGFLLGLLAMSCGGNSSPASTADKQTSLPEYAKMLCDPLTQYQESMAAVVAQVGTVLDVSTVQEAGALMKGPIQKILQELEAVKAVPPEAVEWHTAQVAQFQKISDALEQLDQDPYALLTVGSPPEAPEALREVVLSECNVDLEAWRAGR